MKTFTLSDLITLALLLPILGTAALFAIYFLGL